MKEREVMVDRERPGAEMQRKKGQPWVLRRGAKRQWLHMTVSHGKGEFPTHFPPWGLERN